MYQLIKNQDIKVDEQTRKMVRTRIKKRETNLFGGNENFLRSLSRASRQSSDRPAMADFERKQSQFS